MKFYERENLPSTPGIYLLCCPTSNKVMYVGQSINVRKRFNAHLSDKSSLCEKSRWVDSLRKIGLKPKVSVAETCDKSDLESREVYWINKFGIDNLLNRYIGTPNIATDAAREKAWESKKSPLGWMVFSAKSSLPRNKSGDAVRVKMDECIKKIKKSGRWYTANLLALYRNESLRKEFNGKINYDVFEDLVFSELNDRGGS